MRINTKERHECEKISGKVWHLLLSEWKTPSCGYCMQEVLWSQVANHLRGYKK